MHRFDLGWNNGTWRRLWLGLFVVYVYGWLGYQGVAHRHQDEARHQTGHQDCQLCHISAQPSLAESQQLPPELLGAVYAVAPGQVASVQNSLHAPPSSRGPPSV